MANANIFVGLDVGSSMIRAVAAEKKEGAGLAIVGNGEAQADGMRKGAVVSPDLTARSIQKTFNELRKSTGLELDHATVALGEPRIATYLAKGTVSVSRADGVVTPEDVARVIDASETALPRLGNREVIHTFPLFYTIDRDTAIREPAGLVGAKLEVETFFIACFTSHYKNLIKALDSAGIIDDEVIVAPYAASFQALSKKQKEVGAMVLDIGAETTTLAVFEEGLLVSLEVLPYGSWSITSDIGIGFKIEIPHAERAKRNLGILLEQGKKEIRLSDYPKNFEEIFSQKQLREIVSARLGDIFELVEKNLKRIERSALLPGGVVLVGGGTKLYDIQTLARDALRLPVEIYQGAAGFSGKKELVAGPEWATALGLVRYSAEQHIPMSRLDAFFSSPFSKRFARIIKFFIP